MTVACDGVAKLVVAVKRVYFAFLIPLGLSFKENEAFGQESSIKDLANIKTCMESTDFLQLWLLLLFPRSLFNPRD